MKLIFISLVIAIVSTIEQNTYLSLGLISFALVVCLCVAGAEDFK